MHEWTFLLGVGAQQFTGLSGPLPCGAAVPWPPWLSPGRSPGKEGSGGRSAGAALHQDQPGAWQRDGHTLPQLQRRAAIPAQARVSHVLSAMRLLCRVVFLAASTWGLAVTELCVGTHHAKKRKNRLSPCSPLAVAMRPPRPCPQQTHGAQSVSGRVLVGEDVWQEDRQVKPGDSDRNGAGQGVLSKPVGQFSERNAVLQVTSLTE